MADSDLITAYEFLAGAGTYFIATVDGNVPHVRPFGTILNYGGKLWILTGSNKKVYAQIKANPQYELTALIGNRWIRLHGELVEDNTLEIQDAMLERYPHLKGAYTPGDGVTATLYLSKTSGTIESFGGEAVTLNLE